MVWLNKKDGSELVSSSEKSDVRLNLTGDMVGSQKLSCEAYTGENGDVLAVQPLTATVVPGNENLMTSWHGLSRYGPFVRGNHRSSGSPDKG